MKKMSKSRRKGSKRDYWEQLGRTLDESAQQSMEEYVAKMKRSCPLCGNEKHGSWPCD